MTSTWLVKMLLVMAVLGGLALLAAAPFWRFGPIASHANQHNHPGTTPSRAAGEVRVAEKKVRQYRPGWGIGLRVRLFRPHAPAWYTGYP